MVRSKYGGRKVMTSMINAVDFQRFYKLFGFTIEDPFSGEFSLSNKEELIEEKKLVLFVDYDKTLLFNDTDSEKLKCNFFAPNYEIET